MKNKVIIYTANDGKTKIDVKLEEDTLWLTQAQMCELYQTSKSNVSEHIKHIFEEGELNEESVVRKFRTTAADGKEYLVSHYNLDMIIALGYRVRSIIATRFRQWATERLKEYIVKGFTLDDERLKKLGGVIQKNDGIEVFGKGAPVIYINGRLVRDNSELELLNSSDIKSADVVQNPDLFTQVCARQVPLL